MLLISFQGTSCSSLAGARTACGSSSTAHVTMAFWIWSATVHLGGLGVLPIAA
jgi:hypothetical protein